jgi:hypothetical protein
MRGIIIITSLFMFGAVQAQGLMQEDLNGFLYIKKEFGGASSKQDTGLKLGFTINHSYLPLDGLNRVTLMSPAAVHSPLVDVQYSYKTGYFSRFNVGGVDTLTYRTVLNQNGETSSWPMGLSTTQVVIGGIVAVVGGYFIYEEVAEDGDEEGDVDVNDEED